MNQKSYYYEIPNYIKTEIDKKGFFLYNWIDEAEIKSSIERDFLKFFDKIGFAIGITLIVFPVILFLAGIAPAALSLSAGIFGITFFLLFCIILFISIKRSLYLRKIAYIVITKHYFSLNGKIEKIQNNKIYGDEKTHNFGNLFEEEIFRESYLKTSKTNLFGKVTTNLLSGYGRIMNFLEARGNHSKETIYILFLAIVFYTIYLAIIGIFYFFGIFLLLIVGNIVAFLNKKFLIMKGHTITTINDNFEKINDYSKNLEIERKLLSENLSKAEKNSWKDGLLNNITDTIENVNTHSKKSIKTIEKLKREIQESKYSEMFEFHTYNSWVKGEILSPLEQILSLLSTNKNKIGEKIQDIQDQANSQSDENLRQNLLLAKKRLEMKKEELQKHIESIELFVNKLK